MGTEKSLRELEKEERLATIAEKVADAEATVVMDGEVEPKPKVDIVKS
jgi:hypothetical protein